MGRTVEGPVKTRTSRRRIDLDPNTVTARTMATASHRRRRNDRSIDTDVPQHPAGPSPSRSPSCSPHRRDHRPARIRFHDLRHTHASLLVAAGVPIKVVSERLGHAHPGFTMHTYQHLLPAWAPPPPSSSPTLIDRQPVDIYRPTVSETPGQRPAQSTAVDDPVDDTSPGTQKARKRSVSGPSSWWRGQDLNLRPSGYEHNGLRLHPYTLVCVRRGQTVFLSS